MTSSSYEKVGELGKGSYGVVYEVKNKKGDKYAMKINNTEPCYEGTIYSLREMDILYRGHPNHVVGMIESPYEMPEVKEEDRVCLILEKGDCDGHSFIYKKVSYKDKKLFLIYTMLSIEYLHSRGIVHGDIKPSNMIVFSNSDGSLRTAKITDFSISTFLSSQKDIKHYIVSAPYRPPEVCVKAAYNEKIDCWSFGILALETFMKANSRLFETDKDNHVLKVTASFIPFHKELRELCENIYGIKVDAKKTIENLLKFKPSDIINFNTSAGSYTEFIDVMGRALESDVKKRASMSELLAMPFFLEYKSMIQKFREETDINEEGVWILKPSPILFIPLGSEIRPFLLRFSREILHTGVRKYVNGTTLLFLLMLIDRYVRDCPKPTPKEDYLDVFNALLIISIKYVYSVENDISTLFHKTEGFSPSTIEKVIRMERNILAKVFVTEIWEESYHSCMKKLPPLSFRKLFLLLDKLESLSEGSSYYIINILSDL